MQQAAAQSPGCGSPDRVHGLCGRSSLNCMDCLPTPRRSRRRVHSHTYIPTCFPLQLKKRDIINLQNREETGFTWQSLIEAGYIE